MTEQARNFSVGLFVVGSLGALATLMVWFGEVPDWLATSEWNLQITGVRELSGIGAGSPVNLNGVEIGRVKKIDFHDPTRPDQGVIIRARIKQHFSVPRNATAQIYGATLGFGSGHINIITEPGVSAPPLPKEEGAKIPGEMKSMVGDLISKQLIDSVEQTISNLGSLAEAAVPVADNLAELLEQRSVAEVGAPDAAERGLVANFSTVLERLDNFIQHLNMILGDENVQGDVKLAVRDLKDATEELKLMIGLWRTQSEKLAENLNSGIDRTEKNLERSFVRLNRVLENLDDASGSLAAALRNMAEGKGTVGLLARDDRLYEAGVLALERLGAVMADLKVITGKIKEDGYITVGQAPTGLLKKRFPIGVQASDGE